MNRNQPAAVIAAQQKLLEAAQRQSVTGNNAELQQKLQQLGKQVAAAQAAAQGKNPVKHGKPSSSVRMNSPYARPLPTLNAKPAIIQKYEDLVGVIEELGKDVRPTYAGSKSASERLKRGLQHARQLVRECQVEGEKVIRNQN